MQMLISTEELASLKSRDLVPLKCKQCGKIFYKPKNQVLVYIKYPNKNRGNYCCTLCNYKNKITSIKTNCKNCQKEIIKEQNTIKKSKNKNFFCSSSCAAKYNNKFRIKYKWTDQQKSNFSKKLKAIKQENPFLRNLICCVCGKHFKNKTIKKTCSEICKDKHLSLVSYKECKNNINDGHELTCEFCNCVFVSKSIRKTCNKSCYKQLISKKISLYLKTNRNHIKGPHKQSFMESSFENWLIKNNIKRGLHGYLTEVHFWNKNTKKNGFIDFIFPKRKLIIELDGSHHLKRIDLDLLRDSYLKSKGWNIIRISQKEYIKKIKINKISELLSIPIRDRTEITRLEI
jgi:very-short-patch-repair endonuclease